MAHVQFVRIKKLQGDGILLAAAKHNLREIQKEIGADSHIDAARIADNIVMQGPKVAREVVSNANQLLESANLKRPLRRDHVRALEIVASLPARTRIDPKNYFSDVVTWAQGFYELPILSAVIHMDEAAPHCHILMLPLFDGRMIGSKMAGNRQKLQAMQADFSEKVGKPYGLKDGSQKRRYGPALRRNLATQAADYLKRHPDKLKEPVFLDALRDLLEQAANPALMHEALGLEVT